jgi:hypothetical protein
MRRERVVVGMLFVAQVRDLIDGYRLAAGRR